MKLVLTSSDLSEKSIYKKVIALVGKPAKEISVAVLNEASATEEGDKRWLIEGLSLLSAQFGGEIDIINLLALKLKDIEARLKKADIIFCFGGSTEWLKLVLEKTNVISILPKILKEKVWIGSSAGSMILGKMPTISTQNYIYGEIDYFGVNRYLELVNFSILPHIFGAYVPKDAFEKCIEESKKQDYPVYILSDKAAVIVENDKAYLLGENCYKLISGEIVEKK